MPVKVITDSVADLPHHIAESLGIRIMPLLIRFGETEYRDGVDLTMPEFYSLLNTSPHFPITAFPPPSRFAEMYEKTAAEGNEILVLALAQKLSGTYNSAVTAKSMVNPGYNIEIIDSNCAATAEGFVAMKAADAANSGASLEETAQVAIETRERVHLLSTFKSLKYLQRGGRIGKAKAFLGTTLNIHPLIGLKDSLVRPAGAATSRARAIEKLISFVSKFSHIEKLAVEHAASPEEAALLIDRLGEYHPKEKILLSEMTPVIGAHTGPGTLVICVLGDI